MSHSAFRILTNDESKTERNLVIVVNKNGQVATDTEALQNLLSEFENFISVRSMNSNGLELVIGIFLVLTFRLKNKNML